MVKKEDIVADLKKLLEEDTTRTKIGRIREVYEEIVELQNAGVSIKNIEALLNKRGFDLKPGNLTSYLYQIRQKKEKPERSKKTKPAATEKKEPPAAQGENGDSQLSERSKRERHADKYGSTNAVLDNLGKGKK